MDVTSLQDDMLKYYYCYCLRYYFLAATCISSCGCQVIDSKRSIK